jgi:hypothetical protein
MSPIHVHPALRAREEAAEKLGYIVTLDSMAVTQAKAAEAAGQQAKVVPAGQPFTTGK